MESSLGLSRCGRAVPRESPGEALGKRVAQLQQKALGLGDASPMEWPPRRAAEVEWSQLVSRRQAVCSVEAELEKGPKPLKEPSCYL